MIPRCWKWFLVWLFCNAYSVSLASLSQTELGRMVDVQTNLQFLINFSAQNSPRLERVPVNQLLVLDVVAKPLNEKTSNQISEIEVLKFDAQMPEHKHGMVVTPKITKISATQWRIEGVKLHMAGYWECLLTVKIGNLTKTLKLNVYL